MYKYLTSVHKNVTVMFSTTVINEMVIYVRRFLKAKIAGVSRMTITAAIPTWVLSSASLRVSQLISQ